MGKHYYPGQDKLNGINLELFTEGELGELHRATMELFQNPGIRVEDPEARQLFKENGCDVDEKTHVVKIPEYLVNRALQLAPSGFTLYGRTKENTFKQSHKGQVHWTCFGTGIKMCRYEGHGKFKTEDSVEQDIADCAKVCDWAENIDYFSLPVSARDWAIKGAQDVHETYTPLVNTAKHFQHIDPVGDSMEYYFDLCKAFYGGDEEEARNKPIFSALLCPTSPLELGDNACQVIIKGARYDIPVNVLSMAMAGGSSPVDLAGTLVTHNAEVLSGIVLAQLAQPGAKVWYGSSTTTFDLKRGTAPVGSPELGLISAAVAKMGHYYGLPSYVAGS